MKTVKSADSDGQRTSRMSKEGRRQTQKAEGDSQPIRSQKQEERTNREAAETQDHSALPSVVRIDELLSIHTETVAAYVQSV